MSKLPLNKTIDARCMPTKYILNNWIKLELMRNDYLNEEWNNFEECNLNDTIKMIEEKDNITIYYSIDLSMPNKEILLPYSIKDFNPKIKLISKLRKDAIK